MEYDNTNRGALFKNKKKTTDKHPDYTGQINIDGEEFWLSAWIKDSKGGKLISLAIKPKEVGFGRVAGSAKTTIDLDDEIPF